MKSTTDHSDVQATSISKRLVITAAVAIVYFGAAKFGLGLAFANASASPVWPPTGIALAAVIVLGPQVWPGIWLGAFLGNMMNAGTVATSIGIATGNALEALIGGYLVKRFANGRRAFDRSQDVFKFAALAALVSTSVSATVGVTSLALAGFADWSAYGSIWFTWWLGDMVGALIVTPLLVLWSASPPLRWTRQRVFEATLLVLALILIGSFSFGGLFALKAQNYPLVFVCLPLLIWAAFRFGKQAAAATSLVLSAIALWSTLHGLGPFVRESPNESLLLLQGFMGVVSITALILAATVSEQQEAENALRQSEQKFSTIFEKAVFAASLSSLPDGVIMNVNEAFERAFEYTKQEAVGKTSLDLGINPDVDGRTRLLTALQEQGSARDQEMVLHTKSGEARVFSVNVDLVEIADHKYILNTIQDITERKRAEEQLRESEQRYRTLVEQLPIMVYVNPANDISSTTYVSPQIETFLGYIQREWLDDAQFWSKALHAEDRQRVLAEVERVDRSGEPFDMEYRILAKDGSIVWVRDQAILLRDPKGAPRFWQGIMIDLTERKQAESEREAKLVLETKNAELDRFAYTVSHDLKSPLVTIKGFVNFLKKNIAVGDLERAQGDLNYIESAVNKLQELLTEVLALSRAGLTIKEPEEINCDILAHDVIELLHGVLKASHVKVTIQPNLPIVLGDNLRLQQALQNLIENAIKYQSSQRPPVIEIGTQGRDETGYSILFVRDNGIGIPLEYQDRIFDIFNQVNAKSEGSGVGLATVKRIIEAHGGRIWAESEVEHGATFYFTLPVKRAETE